MRSRTGSSRQACASTSLTSFLAPVAFGDFQQALGAVGAAIEHHVLDALTQFRIEIIDDRQGASVDDAHVHAGTNRVIQEYGVNRLTHGFVAAERKRHVGYAAGDMAMRQRRADDSRVASMKSTA